MKIFISKLLSVIFVGSVTFWYIFTPYLVQPHKRIINDLLSQTSLTKYLPSTSTSSSDALTTLVNIENWTKWRLYVETDDPNTDSNQVIYGSSTKPVYIKKKAVIHMEWRENYHIVVEASPTVNAYIDVPILSFNTWGIYDHFFVEVDNGVVKVIPRFLFGIPLKTVESMYGAPAPGQPDPLGPNMTEDIVGRIPIIGLFSSSNTVDRIIIQLYMFVVLFSIVYLLIVNNPPEKFMADIKKAPVPEKSNNSATTVVNSH